MIPDLFNTFIIELKTHMEESIVIDRETVFFTDEMAASVILSAFPEKSAKQIDKIIKKEKIILSI